MWNLIVIYDDWHDKNKPNLSTICSLRIKSSFSFVLHSLSAKLCVVNLSPNFMNFFICHPMSFELLRFSFSFLTLAVCFWSGTTAMACSRFLAHKLHQLYERARVCVFQILPFLSLSFLVFIAWWYHRRFSTNECRRWNFTARKCTKILI